MEAPHENFEEWLSQKLQDLNADQEVFGHYIKGIVEGDDQTEDKLEALEGVLGEIAYTDVTLLCKEILAKWNLYSNNKPDLSSDKTDSEIKLLAKLMEKQLQSVCTEKTITEEDRKYKEAILAQYSQVSDNEDDDNDLSAVVGKGANGATCSSSSSLSTGPSLVKNTNVEDVIKQEKDKKEKSKQETEKKKALDKASREKQKQQQQERKEKEKKRTQKGERKR